MSEFILRSVWFCRITLDVLRLLHMKALLQLSLCSEPFFFILRICLICKNREVSHLNSESRIIMSQALNRSNAKQFHVFKTRFQASLFINLFNSFVTKIIYKVLVHSRN